MGEEHAAALMEWVPDGPIASKADIDQLRGEFGTEFAHLREIMDLRWEQTATKADIAELRAEMHEGFTKQTWRLVTAMVAINGLFFTAIELV